MTAVGTVSASVSEGATAVGLHGADEDPGVRHRGLYLDAAIVL